VKSEKAKVKMAFKNTITGRFSLLALAVCLATPFSLAFSQTVKVEPKVIVAPLKQKTKIERKSVRRLIGTETSAEKSIAVDAKVNVSLCVREGNLKINGWERNEIRAFVVGGSEVGFKVQQKSRQNDKAVWVIVTGSDPAKNKTVNSEECLSGEEIELDVPRGAAVNVKSRTSEMTIQAVRRAVVKNIGGDISLNNIEQGINAATYQGDVTVENSGGAITLESANGNIVAFDIAPSEIGDIFKAKTNSGAISLQRIEHRQTEINSNSGSIKFAGEFQNGGQYNFGTQVGTISLAIPEKSSCKINALYGYGKFNSELKLAIITEDESSKAQRLVATIGGGDANVNLTTYSGAIRIRKQ
jgi:hypothetical protein